MTHLLDLAALAVVWVFLCGVSALATWATITAPFIMAVVLSFPALLLSASRLCERNLLND